MTEKFAPFHVLIYPLATRIHIFERFCLDKSG